MTISSKTLVLCFLLPTIAIAADSEANQSYISGQSTPYYTGTISADTVTSKATQGYVGAKGGMIMAEKDQAPDLGETSQFGIYGGLTLKNNFGLELEYTMTEDTDVTSKIMGKGQYDIDNYSAFVTYQYLLSDSLYLKSKLGLGGVELTETYQNKNRSTKDLGVAGGMRLGYDLTSNIAVEGEYQLYNSKEIGSNAVTLGAVFKF